MVDICFTIDIVVSFFHAYIDVIMGETFWQPKKIAINYLSHGFVIDVLSTSPVVLRRLVKGDKVME